MQTYSLKDAASHGVEPTPAVMRGFILEYLAKHPHGKRPDIVAAFLAAWQQARGCKLHTELQTSRTKKALLDLHKTGKIRQIAPGRWTLTEH